MNRPHLPFIPSALGWALLSQTIWLPLVAIDLHDRWQASVRQQQPESTALASRAPALSAPLRGEGSAADQQADGRIARNGSANNPITPLTSTGLLLGTAGLARDPLLSDPLGVSGSERGLQSPASSVPPSRPSPNLAAARSGSSRDALSDPPRRAGAGAQRTAAAAVPVLEARPLSPFDPLLGSFSRSELLGGPLSLHDRDAPLMPAVAMAERARWANSGDPLAPLPSDWREPMRRALRALPLPGARPAAPRPIAKAAAKPAQVAPDTEPGARLQTARVVHLPSSKVRRPTAVPLALQSDGSVDILSRPDDPAVVDEIRNWSGRQKAPETGSIAPAVVHLEPMPEPAAAAPSVPPAPQAPVAAAPAPVSEPVAAPAAAAPTPAAPQAAAPAPATPAP